MDEIQADNVVNGENVCAVGPQDLGVRSVGGELENPCLIVRSRCLLGEGDVVPPVDIRVTLLVDALLFRNS